MRRRGKFYCGKSLPIHRLVVLYATQLVGFLLSTEDPASDYFRVDGRSQRACSFHGYLCAPSIPGPSLLYVI